MGAIILLFFNGGGPVATSLTSGPFYIPASTQTVDTYRSRVETVDTYRSSTDDRTQ